MATKTATKKSVKKVPASKVIASVGELEKMIVDFKEGDVSFSKKGLENGMSKRDRVLHHVLENYNDISKDGKEFVLPLAYSVPKYKDAQDGLLDHRLPSKMVKYLNFIETFCETRVFFLKKQSILSFFNFF